MRLTYILAVFPLLTATGCADLGRDYVPILDGAADAGYQTDLQRCQDLAGAQSFNQDTIGAAVVGGVFGGALANHEGDVSSVQGALAGAVFGLIGGLIEGADKRQSIVFECMKGRGHRVVG